MEEFRGLQLFILFAVSLACCIFQSFRVFGAPKSMKKALRPVIAASYKNRWPVSLGYWFFLTGFTVDLLYWIVRWSSNSGNPELAAAMVSNAPIILLPVLVWMVVGLLIVLSPWLRSHFGRRWRKWTLGLIILLAVLGGTLRK